MVQVGLACTQLTRLKARNCPGLTLNAMQGFPELRHLDLTGCDCIAPATAVCTTHRFWGTCNTLSGAPSNLVILFGLVVYMPVSCEAQITPELDWLNKLVSCESTDKPSAQLSRQACVM